MDKSFTPLTLSLPPDGKDVEFWAYGKARVGYRKDGRNWISGMSVVVDGWRFIEKPAKAPRPIPTETAAVADSVPRRGRPRKQPA